ncbi:MAG: hypothetical protein MK085_03150, partial [Phycisphaerales bacterium]|nr:hypothetical protein [Phycisphaerales bacterium]
QRAIIHDLIYQWTDDEAELETAIEFAREGNAKAKSSWAAQELLASLLMQAEEYDNAIGGLEGYLESRPDSNSARQFLAFTRRVAMRVGPWRSHSRRLNAIHSTSPGMPSLEGCAQSKAGTVTLQAHSRGCST